MNYNGEKRKMIYLIDTNAYDNFYKCEKNFFSQKEYAKNVNVQGLKKLLTDKSAQVWVHSATMYELLLRCYKNNNIQEKY